MTAAIRIQSTVDRSPHSRVRHDLPPRPTEATYRRRRAVVGITLAVLVAVGAVATHDVLAGSGGVPASAAESQPAHVNTPSTGTTVARPGDTLWTIAEVHRGPIAITRYVDALVSANGGASIDAGQVVILP